MSRKGSSDLDKLRAKVRAAYAESRPWAEGRIVELKPKAKPLPGLPGDWVLAEISALPETPPLDYWWCSRCRGVLPVPNDKWTGFCAACSMEVRSPRDAEGNSSP